jgi:hypothetical protein
LREQIPRSLPLKAWGVKVSGNSLHVLLINKGPRAVTVSLKIPATSPATVQRLVAPSVGATSGATLAGQTLDEDGAWSGPRQLQAVAPQRNVYRVTTGGYSAALLAVPLRR